MNKRYFARERRHAAIHEAGHILMAWHLGYFGDARIFINEDHREFDEGEMANSSDRTWCGKMSYERKLLSDPEDRFMVGVAGVLAEHFWRNKTEDRGYDPVETLSWDDNIHEAFMEMSSTDRRTAGLKDFYNGFYTSSTKEEQEEWQETENEILETASLIHDLWPNIKKMSRILIDEWKNKETNRNEREKIMESMAR